jgi:hypothetical protein
MKRQQIRVSPETMACSCYAAIGLLMMLTFLVVAGGPMPNDRKDVLLLLGTGALSVKVLLVAMGLARKENNDDDSAIL